MYKWFLGMIFWNPSIIKKTILEVEDFPEGEERAIFQAMKKIDEKGGVINEMEVSRESSLPFEKILSYKQTGINSRQWRYYESQIAEASRKKQIKEVAEKILQSNLPSDVLLSMFTENACKIKNRAFFEPKHLDDFLHESVNALQERIASKKLPGITTGLFDLDSLIGGFQKRRLYYVGARPSQGKSALLVNFAMNGKVPAGFISLESAGREVADRIIIRQGKINSRSYMLGIDRGGQLDNVMNAADALSKKNLTIYDEPNASISKVEAMAYELKTSKKIEILYIDYLQIIDPADKSKPRHEQVSDVSKKLKQLARELDIPIVVAAQLRRDSEGQKPHLSDFSDSTQVERDADVAIMIYNVKEKGRLLNIGEKTYLCVEKNRDGEIKDLPVNFEPKFMTFSDKNF